MITLLDFTLIYLQIVCSDTVQKSNRTHETKSDGFCFYSICKFVFELLQDLFLNHGFSFVNSYILSLLIILKSCCVLATPLSY